jgi:hypothetical protein
VWEGWEAGFMAFHAFHTLSFPWPALELRISAGLRCKQHTNEYCNDDDLSACGFHDLSVSKPLRQARFWGLYNGEHGVRWPRTQLSPATSFLENQ